MQRPSEPKFCKTHNQEKGQYYVINEPWNKLCKKCALNRAVCGYKIEKDLSPQQFQNKLVLASLIQQLKSSIQSCQKKSSLYSSFSQKLNNQIVTYVAPVLKSIDDQLKQLTDIRNKVIEMYEVEIIQKINKCHQIKSQYFMDTISFKKHLQNLQANYCDIIMNGKNQGEQQQFSRQTQVIKNELENNRKYQILDQKIINEELFQKIKDQLKIKYKQFQIKCNSFKILNSFNEPENNQLKIQQQSNQNIIENKFYMPQQHLKQKAFYSHRKNNSSFFTSEENRAPSLVPSQSTYRQMNLTLKSSKRNNSIPLRSKNTKQQTLDLNHLKF